MVKSSKRRTFYQPRFFCVGILLKIIGLPFMINEASAYPVRRYEYTYHLVDPLSLFVASLILTRFHPSHILLSFICFLSFLSYFFIEYCPVDEACDCKQYCFNLLFIFSLIFTLSIFYGINSAPKTYT